MSDHAPIDPDLLDIYRCPVTQSRLRVDGEYLVGEAGGLRYPIRDGIPVLLADEALLPEGVSDMAECKARFTGDATRR